MRFIKTNLRPFLGSASCVLFGVFSCIASAQATTFHFASICRSAPTANKDTVTVTLHDDFHNPFPDVTSMSFGLMSTIGKIMLCSNTSKLPVQQTMMEFARLMEAAAGHAGSFRRS
jgi:hypothetical protein